MTVTPVTTEALLQPMLGAAPQVQYNGGRLHARVRYIDPDAFDRVSFQRRTDKDPLQPDFFARGEPRLARDCVEVDRHFFHVELPPASGLKSEIERRRFANEPSHAFPSHREEIPV